MCHRKIPLASTSFPEYCFRERGNTPMDIIWFLLIGLLAGWLAGQVMKGGSFGVAGDLILGVIGSFVGAIVFGLLGLGPNGALIGRLIVATVGAMVFIALLRLFNRA